MNQSTAPKSAAPTITLVDPSGTSTTPTRTMAPRVATLSGLKMGLLANGKANADVLLNETAALFTAEFGCEVSSFVDKGNASRPALPEHHRRLAAEADFLITAVGD